MSTMPMVFLGTPGPLAEGTLQGLLEGGRRAGVAPPAAVLVAGESPADSGVHDPLAVDDRAGLTRLADAADIPVIPIRSGTDAEIRATLARLRPARVVVACLAAILRAETLTLAHQGMWNVHPSALPHFRGPAPLFWQLRAGLAVGAVSVHRMDRSIDTGRIAIRRPVTLPAGISEPAAEFNAGREAGMAIGAAPGRLDDRWSMVQRAGLGSYQGQPGPADTRLGADWPLQRVWRFMRGTRWRGMPYAVRLNGRDWWMESAVEMRRGVRLTRPRRDAGTLTVPFPGGAIVTRGLRGAQQGRVP